MSKVLADCSFTSLKEVHRHLKISAKWHCRELSTGLEFPRLQGFFPIMNFTLPYESKGVNNCQFILHLPFINFYQF